MTFTNEAVPQASGAVRGGVRVILRLEAFAVLVLATAGYFMLGGNPWLYAIAFFTPDLSFAGFVLGPRWGAAVYNAVHSYVAPALLAAAGWYLQVDLLWQIALIVAAHIGFDRSMGFGLKYATGFQDTHLGSMGKLA